MKRLTPRQVPTLDAIRTHLDGANRKTHDHDLFQACECVFDAWEGPEDEDSYADLAHEALSITPLCSDAYTILAEQAVGIDARLSLFERAVVSGKLCVDQTWLADEKDYGNSVDARPFLRALIGQARAFESIGDRPRAVKNYRTVLKHNKSDNMGVRYLLIAALSMLRDFPAVDRVIRTFDWDDGAFFLYSDVLSKLVQDETDHRARDLAEFAYEQNSHIPLVLLASIDPITLEEFDAPYSHGSEAEALHFRKLFGPAWDATAGATDWLARTAKATGG